MIFLLLLVAAEPCKTKAAGIVLAEKAKTAPKKKLPKGTVVDIVALDGAWVELRVDGEQAFAAPAVVKKLCGAVEVTIAPPAPEPLPAPEPEPVREPEPAPVPTPVRAPEPPPPPPKPKPSDTGKVKVAVMDLKGADKTLTEALTALIPQTLDELGPFKAITKQDIEQMLALERMKDAVGCSDMSCLAEIGGALGADYIISGSVTLVGDTHIVQLQRLNIRTSRAEQRVSREYKGGPQGLFDETRIATKTLVRDILQQKSGTLSLKVSEEGATVRIDGSIVGTTPLKPLAVAGGVHTLGVERESFVRHNQDFEVKEDDFTNIDVTLLPSEDFKKSYKQKATVTRALAFTFTIAGVLAAAGGATWFALDFVNARTLGTEIEAFNAQSTRAQADIDAFNSRIQTLNLFDGLAIATMAAGVILAGVGITLFATGENPAKYDVFVTPSGVAGRF